AGLGGRAGSFLLHHTVRFRFRKSFSRPDNPPGRSFDSATGPLPAAPDPFGRILSTTPEPKRVPTMPSLSPSLRATVLAAALLLPWLPAVPVRADDWPQWRGPNRDGVWRETGILESFPASGLAVRWRA